MGTKRGELTVCRIFNTEYFIQAGEKFTFMRDFIPFSQIILL